MGTREFLPKVDMICFLLNTSSKFLNYSVTSYARVKKETVLGSVTILFGELILNPSDIIQRVFLTGLHHKEFFDSSLILRDLRQQKVKIPTREDYVNPSSCILNSSF